jgi:hypothetical protein
MKRLFAGLMVLGLSVSVFAGYDYVINSGYFGTLTLQSQSLLMTGGGAYK